MKIPKRLKSILYQDEQLAAYIVNIMEPFDDILTKNDLFFFDEYTDNCVQTCQIIKNNMSISGKTNTIASHDPRKKVKNPKESI